MMDYGQLKKNNNCVTQHNMTYKCLIQFQVVTNDFITSSTAGAIPNVL